MSSYTLHDNTAVHQQQQPQIPPEKEEEQHSNLKNQNSKQTNNRIVSPLKRLSFLDRFLTLWILLAMIFGTLLGVYVPSVRVILETASVENVSLPIFVGLLLMLYPVFCKVRYEQLHKLVGHKETLPYLYFSFVMNWIVCPFLMAALAWATLFDLPHFRVGLLLIGVARCIAMVLIWNDLAGGDPEWCAILVAFNSILQMILFSPVGYFFTVIIGGSTVGSIAMWPVAKNVLIFLGIPLFAGALTRFIFRWLLRKQLGYEWYDKKFIPVISPVALLGLLYTIIVMFALQGNQIVEQIGSVARVTVPLVLYFLITWFSSMFLCKLLKFPFPVAITQSFTAGSNNFELALAIAIATFGVDSEEALATTIGPLIEVPVLIALVYVVPWVEKYYVHEKLPTTEEVSVVKP